MRKVFLLLIVFLSGQNLYSQNLREQFESFKEGQKDAYNQFVQEVDEEFAEFLKNNWEEFQLSPRQKPAIKPKPETFPNADSTRKSNQQLPIRSGELIEFEDELIMPVNHKSVDYIEALVTEEVSFFGEHLEIKYDQRIANIKIAKVAPETISEFWSSISKSDYQVTLNSLQYYKEAFALNDFSFYLLIDRFASKVAQTDNDRRLLTWFLMSKMKYKVRIGYNEEQLFLMLSSNTNIYGKNYFNFRGTDYYVFDFEGSKLRSYNKDYPHAFKTIDFVLAKPLNLTTKKAERLVEFYHKGLSYQFPLVYDLNSIDLYSQFPQVELINYFQSSTSGLAQESLFRHLSPVINKMNELDAVSFLLAFVQNGFAYKIDEMQFGREKVFFPEEILHYKYSDCEDRSVFFSYLVRSLLNKETIGVDYPSHVAAAVHFDSEVSGDFYLHNNKKFVVCDPTYIGAPVGQAIKDLATDEAIVIETRNFDGTGSLSFLLNKYGIVGDISTVKIINVQGGIFLTANFRGNLSIQADQLEGKLGSVVSCKFDQDDNLLWTYLVEGSQSQYFLDSRKSHDDDLYILHEKLGSDARTTHLTKIESTGRHLWTTKIDTSEPIFEKANIQVSLFSNNGEVLATKSYVDTDFFKGDRLFVKENQVLVILPIADFPIIARADKNHRIERIETIKAQSGDVELIDLEAMLSSLNFLQIPTSSVNLRLIPLSTQDLVLEPITELRIIRNSRSYMVNKIRWSKFSNEVVIDYSPHHLTARIALD